VADVVFLGRLENPFGLLQISDLDSDRLPINLKEQFNRVAAS